jgi:CheY-like chemotaxis protein
MRIRIAEAERERPRGGHWNGHCSFRPAKEDQESMATVLLVDDDVNLLRALQTLVHAAGHRVCTAPNGQAAMDIARHDRPDVVVTDCMMPVMDGEALCRALKASPLLSDVPVVLTSAVASAPNVPISGFLRKPFAAARLLELIRMLAPLRH